MEVEISPEGRVNVARIRGEIDSRTAPVLLEKLLPLLKNDARVLIDMTGVEFMSSSGLRTLLSIWRQKPPGAQLALSGLEEQIRDTMEVTGLLELFTVTNTVPEGINLLSK